MVMRFLLFGFLLVLALAAIALISVLAAEKGEVRRLPRPLWVALILVLPVVGPALYLWLGRPQRRERPGPQPGSAPSGPMRRPLAPDDDPEFLRRLRTTPPPAAGHSGSARGTGGADPWVDGAHPGPEDLRSGDDRDA